MNAIVPYRVAHWLLQHRIPLLPRVLYYVMFLVYNSSIPPTAEIGRGTRFAYGGIGVVIHARARIGHRVTIGQGITIGGKSKRTGVPEIGDDVYIGAGARILGPVKIGSGSLVAPNAVVVDDVPPLCVVAGIPAKVIRQNIDIRDFV